MTFIPVHKNLSTDSKLLGRGLAHEHDTIGPFSLIKSLLHKNCLFISRNSHILHAGLDAAYPMFGNAEPEGRLDSGDALLVDAIHTCSGSLGFREPYTHVDFYPNGGTRPQPGCVDDDTGEWPEASITEVPVLCLMTHSRNDKTAINSILYVKALHH